MVESNFSDLVLVRWFGSKSPLCRGHMFIIDTVETFSLAVWSAGR